jgi:hypothetical protein
MVLNIFCKSDTHDLRPEDSPEFEDVIYLFISNFISENSLGASSS